MELDFLNTANKLICEYHKYDSTPAQDLDSGETCKTRWKQIQIWILVTMMSLKIMIK